MYFKDRKLILTYLYNLTPAGLGKKKQKLLKRFL